ncbi:EutN/CcmL family microcompartment protein [Euzebya tangerina]|uniref:EutN/CcmL family microcompartment protein n=1 Tax=Euzebya tangerina TaxID=591198 RepID=UPI00196A8A58|nr:EutN/CcmL family microcompartment protein [Euzebya tangerina]
MTGRVWADRQLGQLDGRRMVAIESADGGQLVATDTIDVATGDLVLVVTDDAAITLAGFAVDALVVARVADTDDDVRRPTT